MSGVGHGRDLEGQRWRSEIRRVPGNTVGQAKLIDVAVEILRRVIGVGATDTHQGLRHGVGTCRLGDRRTIEVNLDVACPGTGANQRNMAPGIRGYCSSHKAITKAV